MDEISIYVYFIALSFLVSLTIYFSGKPIPFHLKIFPPFLASTLTVESTSQYLAARGVNNIALYNFFTTFEFGFYLYFISLVVHSRTAKKIIYATIVLYSLAAVANILFYQGMKIFHSVTYAVGCLLVVIFGIYYFLELFRVSRSLRLKYNPTFWICSGLLFFYCCSFPLYAFINYWSGIQIVVDSFDDIFNIVNIFLYLLFTIAFLCIRSPKYTLS